MCERLVFCLSCAHVHEAATKASSSGTQSRQARWKWIPMGPEEARRLIAAISQFLIEDYLKPTTQ